ncbi:fungal hydrophobin [Daedaleopsis nitida]|nr:fungal hydrophobin [Daedaleopsis nitida]
MFSRATIVSTLAFALLAAAGNCNTGPVQCCNKLEDANSAAGSAILSVLGVALQDVTAKLGFDCSPISAVDLGGSTCSAQPVCCENNNVGGLVSIGCVPITL